MSVRQSLLAILDQGACYGYQLRAEFDRRTGSTWPLNVGQIYNTLDRLERDALVEKGETDGQGHVYWQITDAGRAEVAGWLGSPVTRGQGTRDELAIKLAVAATLPGADVAALVELERAASLARLQDLRRAADDAGDVASALITTSMLFAAESELRWLEHARDHLTQDADRSDKFELGTQRPKRGRPARSAASTPVPNGARHPVGSQESPSILKRDFTRH